jgi:hypothetical protein
MGLQDDIGGGRLVGPNALYQALTLINRYSRNHYVAANIEYARPHKSMHSALLNLADLIERCSQTRQGLEDREAEKGAAPR